MEIKNLKYLFFHLPTCFNGDVKEKELQRMKGWFPVVSTEIILSF